MNARTASRANGHRMTRIAGDSDAVFAQAIGRGVLSEDPGHTDFAGHYMYMFHDADDAAWFKHRDTRAYVRLAASTVIARGKGAAPGKRIAPCKGPCKGAAPGNGPIECEGVQS